ALIRFANLAQPSYRVSPRRSLYPYYRLPGGFEMRVRSMAILVLTAAASFGVPTFAHHSQSLFDTTKEILVEGTVARFDWKNPHMYLIVETKGPKGEKVLVEGEGLAITQALVDGLRREA